MIWEFKDIKETSIDWTKPEKKEVIEIKLWRYSDIFLGNLAECWSVHISEKTTQDWGKNCLKRLEVTNVWLLNRAKNNACSQQTYREISWFMENRREHVRFLALWWGITSIAPVTWNKSKNQNPELLKISK